MRLALLVAILLGSPLLALAQDDVDPLNPPPDIGRWEGHVADMKTACAADQSSLDCRVASQVVESDASVALTLLSYSEDRQRARALVRKVIGNVKRPGLRTAAIYALARLGPEPVDTPVLVAFLNARGPTLRRAAWGALRKSPDPAAREWVERAKSQAVGHRLFPDMRPTDAASLGVEPPPGTSPVWFEMTAWTLGGQVFVADGTPEDVLAHFERIAGRAPEALSSVQAWATEEQTAKALARFANAAWFENPRVVVLADGQGKNAGKPVRLAIVWRDAQLGRTGYALQWMPGQAMLAMHPVPWAFGNETPQTLAGGGGDGPPLAAPPWEKEGASEADTISYMALVTGDGTGLRFYLNNFPQGAYRAEVEAMLAEPRVEPMETELYEPSEVRIRFANMPTDLPLRFDVIPRDNFNVNQGYPDIPQPNYPTEDIVGQSSGEVVWKANGFLKPGLHYIRVFAGSRELFFDGVSMQKFTPGDDAFLHRTIRILPRLIPMTLNKQDYASEEEILITYEDMPAVNSPNVGTPFFTITKSGAPPEDWTSYVYVNEAGSGVAVLKAPYSPGAYEVRAKFQQDDVVHGVAAFTVGGAPPAPGPDAGPPEGAAPVPATPAPAAPGGPPPAEAIDPNIKITLAKPSFAPNEPIIATVAGLPGNQNDWVAVVRADEVEHASGRWVYTKGVKEGTFELPGQEAGQYEIRVRFKDEYTPVRARLAFEVK